MIEINNLEIKFEDNLIIDDVDLKIFENELTTIIGVNGSGKSTIIKAINKINDYKGKIMVDGKDVKSFNTKNYAKVVSMLPQHPSITDNIKVIDLIKMGRFPYKNMFGTYTNEDMKVVKRAIEITKIEHLCDKYLFDLSGGQRQKVWIAMVLAQDTKYIFLDEPTSYLDINHQLEVMEILRKIVDKYNKTVVISLHELNQTFQYSDKVVVVNNRKIEKIGIPEEVFTEELLSDIYKIESNVDIKNKEITKIKLKEKNEKNS